MYNRKQYKRALVRRPTHKSGSSHLSSPTLPSVQKYLTEALAGRRTSKQASSDAELKFRIAKCHSELGEKRYRDDCEACDGW